MHSAREITRFEVLTLVFWGFNNVKRANRYVFSLQFLLRNLKLFWVFDFDFVLSKVDLIDNELGHYGLLCLCQVMTSEARRAKIVFLLF